MSIVDRERIAAVLTLRAIGFVFDGTEWKARGARIGVHQAATDAMHRQLMRRADALAGCTEGSNEEAELVAITNAIDAYERVRWPSGRVPGRKV